MFSRKRYIELFVRGSCHLSVLERRSFLVKSTLVLDDKLNELNEHWSIMKQSNDIRTENLLLIQTCADKFWSQHADLSSLLNHIDKQLSRIRPRSTSREHIEREKEKFNQLINDFSNHQIKFKEILEQHSTLLLTLISDNRVESDDIRRNLNELEQEWHRIQTNLNIRQNELEQAMIESSEFNSRLESVATWFDKISVPTMNDNDDEFERIRTFKEHLDCKYLDIVHLKQDYTDIEQQRNDQTTQQNRNQLKENEDRTNLVDKQLTNIDTKWSQLNGQILEQ